MEKIIGQYWVPGLIDGCFVAGGCSVDYNGPGCDSEEPSEEMGSVSLLNEERATHSNYLFIVCFCTWLHRRVNEYPCWEI